MTLHNSTADLQSHNETNVGYNNNCKGPHNLPRLEDQNKAAYSVIKS